MQRKITFSFRESGSVNFQLSEIKLSKKDYHLLPEISITTRSLKHLMKISLVVQMVKNLPILWETWLQSLFGKIPLQEGTATHSSILAWRIPWTEKPGGLWSIASQRVGHRLKGLDSLRESDTAEVN